MKIALSMKEGKEKSEEILRKVEEHERKASEEEQEARRKRMKTAHVSVAMEEELYDKLEAYAKKNRFTISAAARVLIEQKLKEE